MSTITKNIHYTKSNDSFTPYDENLELSNTDEEGIIANKTVSGNYVASRQTGNIFGRGHATVVEYSAVDEKPVKISGKFGDAIFSDGIPRSGEKFFFRNEEHYNNEVKKECRKRCDKQGCAEYISALAQKKESVPTSGG